MPIGIGANVLMNYKYYNHVHKYLRKRVKNYLCGKRMWQGRKIAERRISTAHA